MAQKDSGDWLKINDDVIMSSTILHDLSERVSGLKSFRFALPLAADFNMRKNSRDFEKRVRHHLTSKGASIEKSK